MKYWYNSLLVLALTALIFSCEKSNNIYQGASYVGFADTVATCPIYADGNEFEIAVAATTSASYDRTFAVEVVDSVSTAIEGLHYNLSSNSVTIKAGERSAVVKIEGVFESLESTDSIGVRLRLASQESFQWDLYEEYDRVDVTFAKVCDFDVNLFTGYMLVTSTYNYEFYYGTWQRLTTAQVDPDDEEGKTIIIKDCFADGDAFRDNYDIRVSFNTDDPMLPELELEEGQIMANTRELFDMSYGDGWIRTDQNAYNFSFYNVCQGFAYLVHDVYVDEVGAIGTYVCIFEWISDGEADYYLNNGL